jgi:hypothetical protein
MTANPSGRPDPRARPVAEAPIGALLDRADELARRWATALILARPLERVTELQLQTLARSAPALCAQVIRALESEGELERLLGAGAGEGRGEAVSAAGLGALAGAGGASSASEIVEAVEALRGVLWEALLDELREPAPRQMADLSDRLAYVCAMAAAAALAPADPHDAPARGDGDTAPAADAARPSDDPARPSANALGSPIGPSGAILVDEHEQAEPAHARAAESQPSSEAPRRQARPRPWDPAPSRSRTPPASPAQPSREPARRPAGQTERPASQRPRRAQAPAGGAQSSSRPVAPAIADTAARTERRSQAPEPVVGVSGVPPASTAPEIEVRDQRGEEAPAAWISAIARQLECFEQDQLPFAVLLVELGDAERLRRAALPGAVSGLTGRIERAFEHELHRIGGHPARRRGRPGGTVTSERPGRYWLVVPEADAPGARRLAEWVVHTIGPLAGPRWAPLEVMVGLAVCPDDGREPSALAAHADDGLYTPRPARR